MSAAEPSYTLSQQSNHCLAAWQLKISLLPVTCKPCTLLMQSDPCAVMGSPLTLAWPAWRQRHWRPTQTPVPG